MPKTADKAAEMEPDELTMPDQPDRLRSGFTTGTAATAAAMAAAYILAGKRAPQVVAVRLPGGEEMAIRILESSIINADEAMAVVVKDAGDDPDVTNRAEIGAIVRRRSEPGLVHIIGGPGVGKVTKPGLAVPPGQWAINPGPRAMLRENLTPLFSKTFPGVEVEIFVEKGAALAEKTLNPRLGVLGGMSILGTTGLVKPFSNEAYLATIESALAVARAAGLTEVILTTGRQSEKLAQAQRKDLPPEAFVQVADFFGDSLKQAAERGFRKVGLAVFFGKAVKQAAGHYNTHAHKNDQDTALLAEWLRESVDADVEKNLRQALTARAALDILREAGRLDAVSVVAEKVAGEARRHSGPGPEIRLTVFDYDGKKLTEI
ncbi:MAG: cobalt-precorrin-5B (C(1))-methyltransferase CbiD [Candidatus Adiutrix sp.]|jgi:cobalt-precorrin-5B (C1)-methyltransferase|nr:cobalt-precorrin-5B (C(1))-methyltransferase CbiD [Candidatus Adiutrix sp.]